MLNKVLAITGAGHQPGIGFGVAQAALSQGWKVVVNGRNFDPVWTENQNVCLVPGDITQESTQRSLLETAVNRWGRLDYLVNNASTGAAVFDEQGQITRECWQENFLLNAIVPWELSHRARPLLKLNNGSIVNISSRAALQPGLGNSTAYAVSKGAMNNITEQLALLFAPEVTVNAVCPGFVESQRLAGILGSKFDLKVQSYRDSAPLHESIQIPDIAAAVLHLLTNRGINGQCQAICGGTTIQPAVSVKLANGQQI